MAIDLRRFQLNDGPPAVADVAFMAKVLDAAGQVVDAHLFEASQKPATTDAADIAAALDRAFGMAATDAIAWTLATVTAASGP